MSDLDTLLEILHLERPDFEPLTTIDNIPIPGSLINLETPNSYDVLYRRLSRELAVVNVWTIEDDSGVVVGLTAEVAHGLAGYRSQIRHDRRKGTSLFKVLETEPSLFVKFVQTDHPSHTLKPTDQQLDLSLRITANTANLASACCLRNAILQCDVTFPNTVNAAITILNQWISEGLAKFILITRVSTGIHLAPSPNNGFVFIIHDTILHRGPWLIAHHTNPYPLRHLKAHIDDIGGPTPTIRNTFHPQLPSKSNTTEPIRSDGRLSYSWRIHLGTTIKRCLSEAREKSRKPLIRIPPTLTTKSPIRDFHIFARTTQHSDKSHSRTLARQILSVILDPPAEVERDFSNVQRLCIDYEISENWFLPGRDRKVFTQLQQQFYWREVEGQDQGVEPGRDIYACVNPGVLSRRAVDMLGFEVPFTFQGMITSRRAGDPNGEDPEAAEDVNDSDDDDLDDPSACLKTWRKPTSQAVSQHIRDFEYLTSQGRIYGETDAYMARLLGNETNLEIFHPSFIDLLNRLNLNKCVIFSRVSQKVRNDNSAHTPALTTQSDFCSRFCPPETPTERVECDSISASGDGIQIARRLSEITDTLIVVSSVERICRTHQGWLRLQQLCRSNNLAIVVLVWPPMSILGLSLASQHPTCFLTPDILQRLYHLQTLSRQTQSLPSLFPTLIASKSLSIHPLVINAAHNRIASSESYLRGLSASRYQGSNQIDLPANLAHDRWRAKQFPIYMEEAIRTCLPDIEVVFGNFEGNWNTECHCSLWEGGERTGCQDECRCTCEVCERNQRYVCGLTPIDEWCPCTCTRHHVEGCDH